MREYNEIKEETKTFSGAHYINIVDMRRKKYEWNGIKTILWLNEKHIQEGLGDINLREITIKYHSDRRKHRYELIDEPKKQCNIIFIDKKSSDRLIMDCRTTSAYKFRTRLGFKQYDVILTKEQSVLTKIICSFEGENIQTRYNVLS